MFLDLRPNKRLIKQWCAGDLRRHRAHYDVTVMEPKTVSGIKKHSSVRLKSPVVITFHISVPPNRSLPNSMEHVATSFANAS